MIITKKVKDRKNFIQYLKKNILDTQQRIDAIHSENDDIEYSFFIYKKYKRVSYIKKNKKEYNK